MKLTHLVSLKCNHSKHTLYIKMYMPLPAIHVNAHRARVNPHTHLHVYSLRQLPPNTRYISLSRASAMSWDDGLSNPNTETVDSLSTLAHISDDKKATCHLENNFGNPHDTPQPQELSLCSAYNDNACCPESAVASVETMKESLAEYFLKWDSCGPLSAQCEQYFISEVCFYDCEPAGS